MHYVIHLFSYQKHIEIKQKRLEQICYTYIHINIIIRWCCCISIHSWMLTFIIILRSCPEYLFGQFSCFFTAKRRGGYTYLLYIEKYFKICEIKIFLYKRKRFVKRKDAISTIVLFFNTLQPITNLVIAANFR